MRRLAAPDSAARRQEEVIGKRLEVYEAQTKPLIQHYRENGLLKVVDADADMQTVFASLRRAVEQPAAAAESA